MVAIFGHVAPISLVPLCIIPYYIHSQPYASHTSTLNHSPQDEMNPPSHQLQYKCKSCSEPCQRKSIKINLTTTRAPPILNNSLQLLYSAPTEVAMSTKNNTACALHAIASTVLHLVKVISLVTIYSKSPNYFFNEYKRWSYSKTL